jgi:transposase
MGALPMAAPQLWTEQKISEVRHLLIDEGLTRRQAADRVGVSESAIIHIIEKHRFAGLSRHQRRHGHKTRVSRSS